MSQLWIWNEDRVGRHLSDSRFIMLLIKGIQRHSSVQEEEEDEGTINKDPGFVSDEFSVHYTQRHADMREESEVWVRTMVREVDGWW